MWHAGATVDTTIFPRGTKRTPCQCPCSRAESGEQFFERACRVLLGLASDALSITNPVSCPDKQAVC